MQITAIIGWKSDSMVDGWFYDIKAIFKDSGAVLGEFLITSDLNAVYRTDTVPLVDSVPSCSVLSVGKTTKILPIMPGNVPATITCASNNSAVATVDTNGVITGIGPVLVSDVNQGGTVSVSSDKGGEKDRNVGLLHVLIIVVLLAICFVVFVLVKQEQREKGACLKILIA